MITELQNSSRYPVLSVWRTNRKNPCSTSRSHLTNVQIHNPSHGSETCLSLQFTAEGLSTCDFLAFKLKSSSHYLFSCTLYWVLPLLQGWQPSFPAVVSQSFSPPPKLFLHSWLSCPLPAHLEHSTQSQTEHSITGLGSTHINNYCAFSLRVLHRICLLTHLRKIIMIHIQFLLPWSFSPAGVMSQLFPK